MPRPLSPSPLDENRRLEHRADLLYRTLSLTSVGFNVRYGMIMVGARVEGDADVRQASAVLDNTGG